MKRTEWGFFTPIITDGMGKDILVLPFYIHFFQQVLNTPLLHFSDQILSRATHEGSPVEFAPVGFTRRQCKGHHPCAVGKEVYRRERPPRPRPPSGQTGPRPSGRRGTVPRRDLGGPDASRLFTENPGEEIVYIFITGTWSSL